MTLSRAVFLLLCCTIAVSGVAADSVQLPGKVNWHPSFAAASNAAQDSGKPILAFVYVESHPPSATLANELMPRKTVIKNLQKFELLGVPYGDETHQDFLNEYDVKEEVSPADDGSGEVRFYPALPAMLYLNADGTEYLRDKGYTPAPGDPEKHNEKLLKTAAAAFSARLARTRQLITFLRRIADEPTAGAHADAGHLLLQMNRYARARTHLQKAMSLDPDNKSGAFADAYLDTIVLGVARKPEQALHQLEDFQARFPDSDRLLEAQYYQAVCLVALERYDEATPVLSSVCEKTEDTPLSLEPWYVPATRLLNSLKQLQQQS